MPPNKPKTPSRLERDGVLGLFGGMVPFQGFGTEFVLAIGILGLFEYLSGMDHIQKGGYQ